jgi:hypothetical protein
MALASPPSTATTFVPSANAARLIRAAVASATIGTRVRPLNTRPKKLGTLPTIRTRTALALAAPATKRASGASAASAR